LKRRRIHRALRRTLGLPLPFLAGLALLLLLMGLLVRRNILRPLALIQHTTQTVAEGNFAPIPYSPKSKNEVTDLMVAFNKMAHEIENRQTALVQSRKIAAIGTFTSGIAHELNNPINNIRLTAETLLDDLETMSQDETRELATDILTQADRASEIVKNLLEFSRTDSPSSMRRLGVKEVLERTYKLVKNQIVVGGITLDSDVPDTLPPTYGNFQNLQQVFLNLLLNAVQAMPQGGTITVKAGRESDRLIRIDVTDTGDGIKPDDLDHIFDPFYTTKDVGSGTGLGLSVTYSIVKKHGGYIEVKSEVGRGTTFSVFLPVVMT
jgi:two-component system NtrC family sensor kinase